MQKYSSLVLAAALFAPSVHALAADCLGKEALPAAKNFLGTHYSFYADNPAKLRSILTPRLFKILETEHKCAQGDICALESDPWLSAQDGKMSKKVDYAAERATNTEALVDIRYDFILSPKNPPEKKIAKLLLQRSAADQCWLVGDLISPGGESLVTSMEKWHAEYGAASKNRKQ